MYLKQNGSQNGILLQIYIFLILRSAQAKFCNVQDIFSEMLYSLEQHIENITKKFVLPKIWHKFS